MDSEWAVDEARKLVQSVDDCNRIAERDTSGWYFSHTYGAARDRLLTQLPVAVRIARSIGETGLAELLRNSIDGQFAQKDLVPPSRELLTLLERQAEMDERLAPLGPTVSAANLHPWVWGVAASLWDDGYRREAVQAAATAVFDSHLRAKLGLLKARPQELAGAFATSDPTPGSPRLRLPGFSNGTDDWNSAHDGAAALGRACAMAIRNLSTHSVEQPDEQVALEALAALSLFARWADEATVEKASH